MDWIYINTSKTSQERLDSGMENGLELIASYSPACATILEEYLCVSNYPSCDLSSATPRPIMVSSWSDHQNVVGSKYLLISLLSGFMVLTAVV